jgi:glucosamine 6-phosphate synthetase-like amidotransferase/phosphosugar isomerase protein
MCGLFGFFDKEKTLTPESANELAQGMAISAMDRGEDATGYAILSGSEIKINKMAMPANLFAIDTENTSIFMGHTRFATMGDPQSDAQAHPFLSQDEGFALAHNGQASKDYYRLLKDDPSLSAQIDSEGMIRYIEKYGFDHPGVRRFCREWNNSTFAISIIDASNESLVLFRNNGSPLVVGQTSCGVIVYASTTEILEMGCFAASLWLKTSASIKSLQRYELSLLKEELDQHG